MGLFGTAGRAAVASSVVGRVKRKRQQRFAAEDAASPALPAVSAPASVAFPAAAPVESDAFPAGLTDQKLAQLQQLGELLNAGVLTDEEFQVEKAKILAV